jgi:hypothetical protein
MRACSNKNFEHTDAIQGVTWLLLLIIAKNQLGDDARLQAEFLPLNCTYKSSGLEEV